MINTRFSNQNILVSNLGLLDGQIKSRLIADSNAGSSSITVANIAGFTAGNYYLLFGNFGDSNAEIVKIHASTAPTGFTITLAAATAFDHYSDTPITVLDYNQIEYSRATTLAGSKSVLVTQAINANLKESVYKDLVNTTGYAFARFKNAGSSAFSPYSTGVPYTGLTFISGSDVVTSACDNAGVEVGSEYAKERMLLKDLNDCQDMITKFDWIFELIRNESSIAVTVNENTFDLSSLTYQPKYMGTKQGIKSVLLGSTPLTYIDMDEMDDIYKNTVHSTLAVSAGALDDTIALVDTSEFADEGTLTIGEYTVEYTANDRANNEISGITVGDIGATFQIGASVWQGASQGFPTKYSIFDGAIVLDRPVDIDHDSWKLKVTYLKMLTRFTDLASVTDVLFPDIMSLFIESRIERRKRNFENSKMLIEEFNSLLSLELEKYKLPLLEEYQYYQFFDFPGEYDSNID